MQTMKEMVRDNILIAMKPYLDKMAMDMLNQAIVKALFPVDVIESQTLSPADQEVFLKAMHEAAQTEISGSIDTRFQ